MDSDDPTVELEVDITDQVPRVDGESNGPPLMWFGLAAFLTAAAVGLIVFIGQSRDESTATTVSSVASTTSTGVDDSPGDTPPLGDPGASATDDFDSTADTSPPDEASDEATSTDDPATTPSTTVTSIGADNEDDGEEGGEGDAGSLVVGEPTITSTSDDFEITLATSVCTTVEWSFAGEGQAASYSSEEACFDEHLLSPRPEHPLLPATEYVVTASFEAGVEMQVISLSVTTAP